MQGLIADRFVVPAEGRVVDLATGLDVSLERSGTRLPTSVIEAPAWLDGREVIDAGSLNASATFVAWSARGVPDVQWPSDDELRGRLAGALEMIDTAGERVRACSLASRSPDRLEHAWLVLARAARLRGIVPLAAHVIDARPDVVELLAGRLVAVLAPAGPGGDAVGALVRTLASGGRHGCRLALLFSFGRESGATSTVDLDAGRPPILDRAAAVTRIDQVADAPPPLSLFDSPRSLLSSETFARTPAAQRSERSDPIVERCQRRLARANRTAARGRRAACMRDLQSVLGSTKSRDGGADLHARAAVSLADSMLMAGQVAEAERTARQAIALGTGSPPALAVAAACLLGHAWIEQQRFDDAAGILTAAVEGSRVFGGAGASPARLVLARCRFWQGRLDDAERLLDTHTTESTPGFWRAVLRMRTRLLLARGEAGPAGTLLASGLLRLTERDPRDAVSTSLVSACVQAAVGDMDAVRTHVAEALRSCRQAALTPRATAVHIALVEAASRLGAADDAQRGARFLVRARPNTASALLRARIDRALEAAGRGPARGRVARPIDPGPFGVGRGKGRVVVDELLEVLTICHEADDDGPALERVCAALRTRLGASCVCVVGERPESRLALSGHHRAVSEEVAQRAIATGAIVPTALVRDGWEAAAPVRYGGATIAALACRWTVDSTPDRARVEPVLATAAAACAPSVRAALDRAAAHSVAENADLGLIGTSRAIDGVRSAIVRAAGVPFHVLIEGESGSGKELVAKAIHRVGPRRGRRFCAVNCAALPDDLLEAELFGHARGAFTGAVAERAGLFEDADGGTLFLDEVGELSPRAQAKLLRAIQENEVRRLGEALPRRVDVRIVAASNRSLSAEAEAGRFRVDLRYRLEVVRIAIPPLRERREDIVLLAGRFWDEFARRAGTRALLDRSVLDALVRYDWPGNVRELQNVVASLAVHAPRRGRVGLAQMPAALGGGATARGSTLDEARRAFEASYVRQALCRAGGRRSAAARELGVTRQGLSKLMARLGVGAPEPTGAVPGAAGREAPAVRAELA